MTEIPLLILVLFLIAVLLRLDVIFYLVYVLFGVYAVSRWWTTRGLRVIEVKRRFQDHAFLGEEVTVQLELRNRALLPIPWLHVHESVPITLRSPSFVRRVTSLRPREAMQISYELPCRRRGYYGVGPLTLSGGDLFGFAQAEHRAADTDHLTVYPEIIPLSYLGLPSKSPFGTIRSHQPVFEDPSRVTGVRDYRGGDSLRRIHWKASAREGNLLVKKYEPAISLETAIFLNLNSEDYRQKRLAISSEWAIIVAASIAAHLVQERQAVGLITNGRDPLRKADDTGQELSEQIVLPPRPGRLHLMKVLEVLARVETQSSGPFHDWIPRASLPLAWGSTVVAITPSGDEEACRTLHRLCRQGFNVVLVVIDPRTQFGLIRQRAQQLGFLALEVATRQDMGRWQQ